MKTSDLPIASPCGQSWADMIGSDARRFCDACEKHVHDLSAMTRAEAAALLRAPATAGLCVRYLHDDDGTIMFRDVAPPLVAPGRLARVKRAAMAAAALALPMSLTACMGASMPPPVAAPQKAVETRGEGQPCGAYPAAGEAITKCADGLTCDHTGAAVDGPGVCKPVAPSR